MDVSAFLIMLAWAGLAGVFGYGWLRCGNGHWRWSWLRTLTRRFSASTEMSPNAPIYGLIAVGCLSSTVLYFIIAFKLLALGMGTAYLNRTLGELVMILVFVGVAVIRKPWGDGG
jgi:hypothetical protein